MGISKIGNFLMCIHFNNDCSDIPVKFSHKILHTYWRFLLWSIFNITWIKFIEIYGKLTYLYRHLYNKVEIKINLRLCFFFFSISDDAISSIIHFVYGSFHVKWSKFLAFFTLHLMDFFKFWLKFCIIRE